MNLEVWYERDPRDTCIIKMRQQNTTNEPFTFILVHNDNKYEYNVHQHQTLKGIAELLGTPNIEERPWKAYDISATTNLIHITDKQSQ